jgi:hypothetical protein
VRKVSSFFQVVTGSEAVLLAALSAALFDRDTLTAHFGRSTRFAVWSDQVTPNFGEQAVRRHGHGLQQGTGTARCLHGIVLSSWMNSSQHDHRHSLFHRTLRVSPAMAAGVTTRLFEVSDLVNLLIESESEKAA